MVYCRFAVLFAILAMKTYRLIELQKILLDKVIDMINYAVNFVP